MTKRIALVLSGCGVQDGSEIHEAVLTSLAITKAQAETLFFAPRGPQARVINHLTSNKVEVSRDILEESARIAGGKIRPLEDLTPLVSDAVVFPGGFGAALNLCDFAERGANCEVHREVERVIKEFYESKKPQGFICIAPVLAAKVLGQFQVELTIGNDPETAKAIETMGARHFTVPVSEIHLDRRNRVVSTPAYMLARSIAEVEAGVSKLIHAVLNLVGD